LLAFNFIYLLSLVCWLGSIIFFSFFVVPVVFKTLDREKAGEIVGIIFPRYYKLGYVCGALILLSFMMIGEVGLKWCAWGIMVLGSGLAGLVINPKAKKIKLQLKSLPDNEKSTLEAKFKNLHSLSVKLNALVLFSGLWLLGLTALNFQI
jgi:uncharacterized membrane protein